MVHLWVDPIYGDALAAAAAGSAGNPSLLTPTCNGFPPYNAPVDVIDPTQPSVSVPSPILVHASKPFRTITAAVRCITNPPGSTQVRTLPYTFSFVGINIVWRYAIIHLLPGVYARGQTYGAHPDNGLPANGETFPIYLPSGVSIQGTSALNTLIDLEGVGPAFEFGVRDPVNNLAIDGRNTFIDSVSIYGANPPTGTSFYETASGIYLRKDRSSAPTISNCFIFRNHFGVFIAATTTSAGGRPSHLISAGRDAGNTAAAVQRRLSVLARPDACSTRDYFPCSPDTEQIELDVWSVAVPPRCPCIPGRQAETPTATDARLLVGDLAQAIAGANRSVVRAEPVPTPLEHVAVHVVEPKAIGAKAADRSVDGVAVGQVGPLVDRGDGRTYSAWHCTFGLSGSHTCRQHSIPVLR